MKRILVASFLILCFAPILNGQVPAFRWARDAGGSAYDVGNGIAVDTSGNTYVTGDMGSSTANFGPIILTNASSGHYDMFVAKYDASGGVAWARCFGGTDDESGRGIATDNSGGTYVTGYFYGSTMTFSSTTLTNSSTGYADLYLTKFDANGNVLWAKSAGGTGDDLPFAIAVDVWGNSYVTGYFSGPTITFGSTTLTNASAGSNDVFIVKYGASGNVIWAKSAGGTNSDLANSIAVDQSGNSYVTGSFYSSSITFGSTILTNANAGFTDMFVAKYDPNGNVVWAKSSGGSNYDAGYGVAVDASGNSIVTGSFNSPTMTFGPTTLTNANAGFSDMFLAKYDADGNVLWARGVGGSSYEVGFSVGVDASKNCHVTGYFSSPSVTFGSTTLIKVGGPDIFVVEYDPNGNVVWAKSAGGPNPDQAYTIAVDPWGNSSITGGFQSPTALFDSTRLTNAGSTDIFIAKLDGDPPALVNVKDVPNDQGGRLLLQWNAAASDKFVEHITVYSIWRALPAGQIPPSVAPGDKRKGQTSYREFSVRGMNYYWEWIANQPPLMWPQYAYAAATLSDSVSPISFGREYFVVVAQTEDPNIFYVSNVDSGYSVDNIPPVPPAGLAAVVEGGHQVYLSWNSPSDPDVGHYDVYRSTTSGFTPAPGFKIGSSSTIGYTDESPLNGSQAYYRIIAVDVHGNPSVPSTQVGAGITTSTSLSVDDRWNMISVPMAVSDYSKSALFPTALSPAFGYQGSYQIYGTLQKGVGYWLKFNGDQSVMMAGYLLTQDTIGVSAGWNMIGSLSGSIPVANVGSIPGGMITSNFFGYNGSYHVATKIEPGQGYWVKVNQSGKLVLSSSGNTPASLRVRIELQDGMPPAPPNGDEAYGNGGLPAVYQLEQNYPNPFNPSTVIKYSLPSNSHVKLSIYNTLGQEVMKVVDEDQDAGYKSVPVNMNNLPTGLYTYRITAGTFSDVKKMVLVK